MSESLPNGTPNRKPAPMIELPGHNGFLIRMDDEDPDAIVDRTIQPAKLIPRIHSEPVADMQEELGYFQRVMEEIERGRSYRFFHWRDVLEAIHDMGYRKVAKPRIELDPRPEAKS